MAYEDLTTKQQLFVEAYLQTANATESARRAGYKGSDETLAVVGAENLRKPKIAAYTQKRIEAAVMSADKVLEELSDIATSDWRDHMIEKRDRNGEVYSATFKLNDKLKALELVGKYHKIFTDRVEHTHIKTPTQEAMETYKELLKLDQDPETARQLVRERLLADFEPTQELERID